MLASTSDASLNTSRRLAFLTSTPHALKQLESDLPPSETVPASTNVGSAEQFWSRRRGGRQGRAGGAPLRGRRALTALRRREIWLPCCRGSLSVTSSDVSDLTSPAQSVSACLCRTLQKASTRCRLLQNPQCKIVQFRAKKCFRMLQNASFCCVHTCAPSPGTKNCILLENYYLPGNLQAGIDRFVDHYREFLLFSRQNR